MEATVIRKSRVSPGILTGTAEWTAMELTEIETVRGVGWVRKMVSVVLDLMSLRYPEAVKYTKQKFRSEDWYRDVNLGVRNIQMVETDGILWGLSEEELRHCQPLQPASKKLKKPKESWDHLLIPSHHFPQ